MIDTKTVDNAGKILFRQLDSFFEGQYDNLRVETSIIEWKACR